MNEFNNVLSLKYILPRSQLLYFTHSPVRFPSGDANSTAMSPCSKCRNLFSFFNCLYIVFVANAVLVGFAYFTPYNLLYKLMLSKGQTKEYSSLALSISGGGSIFARVLVGFMGDFKCFHRIYYYIMAISMCGVTTIVCVYFTVFWQYLCYGFLYGMGAGQYICILNTILRCVIIQRDLNHIKSHIKHIKLLIRRRKDKSTTCKLTICFLVSVN